MLNQLVYQAKKNRLYLFNFTLKFDELQVPEMLKKSALIPIHNKVKTRTKPESLKAISLANLFCELMESLVIVHFRRNIK